MESMNPDGPLREFIGFIWIADEPGLRLSVMARSVQDAREVVTAEHGEGHAISLWNEEDASKPRSEAVGSESFAAEVDNGDDEREAEPPCGSV